MPKTIVVGDSVAVGIGGAISGATVFAAQNARIDQMGDFFVKAIEAAGKDDTVVISAGYNCTGADGLVAGDLANLQDWVDQLNAKGARVVIAGLRETGMTGAYAGLNGPSKKTNTQLRGIKGATFSEQSVTDANAIEGGEIHGNYAKLAQDFAAADASATSSTASSSSTGDDWLSKIFDKIGKFLSWIGDKLSELFKSIFPGSSTTATTTTSTTTGQSQSTAQDTTTTIDTQVGDQAQAAAGSTRLPVADASRGDSVSPGGAGTGGLAAARQ